MERSVEKKQENQEKQYKKLRSSLYGKVWPSRPHPVNIAKKGARVDALNSEKLTPLHMAADNGHVTSVEALLAAGADFTLRAGKDECSILDFAVIRGNMDIVRGK